jgi:predicted  nucleic acid-binding Zn-ribbon protein
LVCVSDDAEIHPEPTGVRRSRLSELEDNVLQLRTKVEGLDTKVDDLGERVAKADGQLSVFVGETKLQTELIKTIATKHIEVDAEQDIAQIRVQAKKNETAIADEADRKATRRRFLLTVATAVLSGSGLLALLEHVAGC